MPALRPGHTRSGFAGRSSCGVGPRCTSERHNAQKTEIRTVRYPWHPWYDRSVLIRESFIKNGLAVYRCILEPAGGAAASLEVPEWMFERAVCCGLRCAERPMADCAALLRLKALLSAAAGETVIEARHHSSSSKGDADATPGPGSSRRSTRSVPTCQAGTELVELAVRGERASAPAPGSAVVDEPRVKRRRRAREDRQR
jgi:hypothetical protein